MRVPLSKEFRITSRPAIGAAVFLGCMAIIGLTFGRQVDRLLRPSGTTYYVSPSGDDTQTGKQAARPLRSVQKAISRAQPGDRVHLADGAYHQSVVTVRSGRKGAPITIEGSRGAVLYGATSRIFEIHHSYITLQGFHINGQIGPGTVKKDFRDKLIYAIGQTPGKGVEHLKIDGLLVENAGGECIRLRYLARHNEISNSTIRNCGIYDFRLRDGGKNGEGIYIGTAPEQRKDGKNPTASPDVSMDNYIHHNTIRTEGNECVDIKEAATKNLVEYNTCSAQRDPESGGFDARGSDNTFRYNHVIDTIGAAVRLGGDEAEDGIHNNVYDNTFADNRGGALMLRRLPQGKICNNSMTRSTTDMTEENSIDAAAPCE